MKNKFKKASFAFAALCCAAVAVYAVQNNNSNSVDISSQNQIQQNTLACGGSCSGGKKGKTEVQILDKSLEVACNCTKGDKTEKPKDSVT